MTVVCLLQNKFAFQIVVLFFTSNDKKNKELFKNKTPEFQNEQYFQELFVKFAYVVFKLSEHIKFVV